MHILYSEMGSSFKTNTTEEKKMIVVFTDKLHREEAVMQKPELSDKLKQAKEEAVYGMLVADAVAMPVHWYYNPEDIKRGYGSWLTGYIAPNNKHPSSILNLSAVGE